MRSELHLLSVVTFGILLAAGSVNAATPGVDTNAQREHSERGSMYRHSETPITATDVATSEVRKRFATCVYRLGGSDVDEYLASQDYSNGWAKLMRIRAGGMPASNSVLVRCLGREAGLDEMRGNVSTPTFRVMMAEEAYLSRFDSVPSLPSDAPEVLTRVPLTVGTDPQASTYLAAVADCLVYRNVQGADALVRTKSGSPEERVAAVSLASAFGSCLPKERTLKNNTQTMRSLAVEGLWARYARTVH